MTDPAPGSWAIPTDRPFDLELQGGSWLCDCRYREHTFAVLVVDFPLLNRLVRAQLLLCRIGQIRYGLTVDEQLGGEARVPLVEVGIVHD